MENAINSHKRGVLTATQSNKVKALFDAMYPSCNGYLDNHYDKENEIADFLQLGFTPYFSFYGENNCLNPLISWYGFYGKKEKDYLNLVICVNSSKEEYTVYKDNRKIGVFNDLNDILNLFKIKEYTPELSSIYTDFLLFEKDKLGEILKKAKSLMDDDEWNKMVDKASIFYKNSNCSENSLYHDIKSLDSFSEDEKKIISEKLDNLAKISENKPILEGLYEKTSEIS